MQALSCIPNMAQSFIWSHKQTMVLHSRAQNRTERDPPLARAASSALENGVDLLNNDLTMSRGAW